MSGVGSTAAVRGMRCGGVQGLASVFAVLAANIFSQDVFAQTADDMAYQWHRVLSAVHFSRLIALDSGQYVVSGRSGLPVDFDPGAGVVMLEADRFVAKYREDGSLLWVRGFNVEDDLYAIAVDNAGNVHLAGAFSTEIDFDPGPDIFNLVADDHDRDVFYVKLDVDGDFVTAFDIDGGPGTGGFGGPFPVFQPNHVQVDDAGNVYIVGGLLTTIDIDPGPGVTTLTSAGGSDIGIAKFNAAGVLQWGTTLGTAENEGASACAVTGNGMVYCTGTVSIDPATSLGDLYVFALDTAGNVLWEYAVGTTPQYPPTATAIALDSNGDVVITGTFDGTFDFDPGPGVTQITSIPNSVPADNTDIFAAKLDGSSGALEWAKQLGNSQDEVSHTLRINSDDEVLLAGTFELHTELDPGPGTTTLVAPDGYLDTVGFISALDSAGNFLWAKRVGEVWLITASAIEEDGSFVFGGQWTGTRDLIPGPLVSIHTAPLSYNGYLVRMAKLDSVPSVSDTGLVLLIGLMLTMALLRARSRKPA